MKRLRYWLIGAFFSVAGLAMCFAGEVTGSEALSRWSMYVNGMAMGCILCFLVQPADEGSEK